MDRSIPPLRRLLAGALLVTGTGLGTVLLLEDDPAPEPVARDDGYRITYDVEDLVASMRQVEVVEVDGALTSRRTSGSVGSATTGSGVYDLGPAGWRQVAVVPPGEAGHDLRPVSALLWAESRGEATREGVAVLAGRRCTWWVTREPLELAPMAAATDGDRTRSCVDERGLLLGESWRAGGSELRRRTAASVEPLATLDVFDGSPPQALPPGLALAVVEELAEPSDDLVELVAPQGFSLVSASRTSSLQPGTVEVVARSVRAVWTDRRDLLVLDQVRGSVDARGREVVLGELGTGRVLATGGGLVVVVPLGEQQALRVRSSMRYDALVAWLSGLRRT